MHRQPRSLSSPGIPAQPSGFVGWIPTATRAITSGRQLERSPASEALAAGGKAGPAGRSHRRHDGRAVVRGKINLVQPHVLATKAHADPRGGALGRHRLDRVRWRYSALARRPGQRWPVRRVGLQSSRRTQLGTRPCRQGTTPRHQPQQRRQTARPERARPWMAHRRASRSARQRRRVGEFLVLVLAYCGLRWSNWPLRVRDVDLMRRRLNIERAVTEVNGGRLEWNSPKNHERRSVPLPRFIVFTEQRRVRARAARPGRPGYVATPVMPTLPPRGQPGTPTSPTPQAASGPTRTRTPPTRASTAQSTTADQRKENAMEQDQTPHRRRHRRRVQSVRRKRPGSSSTMTTSAAVASLTSSSSRAAASLSAITRPASSRSTTASAPSPPARIVAGPTAAGNPRV